MSSVSRWLAPTILAAGLGFAALSPVPAFAQSGEGLVRVLVDVADVVVRGNTPYYRNGDYGNDDRLLVERDRYGRPVYYRQVRNDRNDRNAPPYGNAYGYHRNAPNRQVKCNKHGKCKTTYYDPRHDQGGRRDEHRHDDRRDDDHRRRNGRDDD